eukprot:scaffold5003_cov102-Isochrysis_galbana.AAC.3
MASGAPACTRARAPSGCAASAAMAAAAAGRAEPHAAGRRASRAISAGAPPAANTASAPACLSHSAEHASAAAATAETRNQSSGTAASGKSPGRRGGGVWARARMSGSNAPLAAARRTTQSESTGARQASARPAAARAEAQSPAGATQRSSWRRAAAPIISPPRRARGSRRGRSTSRHWEARRAHLCVGGGWGRAGRAGGVCEGACGKLASKREGRAAAGETAPLIARRLDELEQRQKRRRGATHAGARHPPADGRRRLLGAGGASPVRPLVGKCDGGGDAIGAGLAQ